MRTVVRRLKLADSAVFVRFKGLPARALPGAAAAIAGLLLWHAARDDLALGAGAQAPLPAPLVAPAAAPSQRPGASVAPAAAASQPPSASAQRSSVTTEVVVGRNDTLDAIFRRI